MMITMGIQIFLSAREERQSGQKLRHKHSIIKMLTRLDDLLLVSAFFCALHVFKYSIHECKIKKTKMEINHTHDYYCRICAFFLCWKIQKLQKGQGSLMSGFSFLHVPVMQSVL